MKSGYDYSFHWLLMVGLLIMLQSCSAFRKSAIPAEEIKPENPKNTEISALLSVEDRFEKFNSFQAKTKVEFFIQGNNQEVNSQLRWIRDSVLWMNFSLVGIEGARLLVTKDSFFLIDRINKKYMAEKISDMAKKYNLPLSFSNLQAIFLGYPVILSKEPITEDKKTEFVHYTQQDSLWRGEYYTENSNQDFTKMHLVQKKGKNSLTTELADYRKVPKAGKFAFNRIIEFYSTQIGKARLNILFKEITVNTPKEIKFSIPSRYEKM